MNKAVFLPELRDVHPQQTRGGPLTEDMCAQFKATGWVFVPGLFELEQVAQLSDWIDELLARPERPGTHWLYRQASLLDPGRKVVQRIENFCPHHAAFDRFVRQSMLSLAVEQLLDGPACLFKEKINFKEAGGEGFALHQDQQAGWSRYAPLFVTAAIAVDPATLENGCLQVADTDTRIERLIGAEWRPITPAEAASFTLRPVPTAPGDAIFFDSYFPHASADNLTAERRRMLFISYNSADYGDVRQPYHDDKRAHFPPTSSVRPGLTINSGCRTGVRMP